MLDPQAKIRRNPQVTIRELEEGEAVLLHLESGAYHGLNPVGVVIWELLENEQTVAELAEGVRSRTEDPPETLEDDINSFLESARERDLLVVSG